MNQLICCGIHKPIIIGKSKSMKDRKRLCKEERKEHKEHKKQKAEYAGRKEQIIKKELEILFVKRKKIKHEQNKSKRHGKIQQFYKQQNISNVHHVQNISF